MNTVYATATEKDEDLCRDFMAEKIIPKRFRLTNYNPSLHPALADLYRLAIAWADAFSAKNTTTGIYLHGQVGCGKTMLACEILKRLIWRGYQRLKYYNIADLLSDIRACWDKEESESELLEEIGAYHVVVLDDLGIESTQSKRGEVSQWILDRFYLILDRAYRDCRPIFIITSNFKRSELLQRYGEEMGERLLSRIADLTESWTGFPQTDLRIKIRKEQNQ